MDQFGFLRELYDEGEGNRIRFGDSFHADRSLADRGGTHASGSLSPGQCWPEVAPELPIIEKPGRVIGSEKIIGGGTPREVVEARKKHEAQRKARREAEFIRDMVAHRDLFVRQIAELYSRPPEAEEELRRLAMRILGDKTTVERLLDKVARISGGKRTSRESGKQKLPNRPTKSATQRRPPTCRGL